MKMYVTFGWNHTHHINDATLDHNSVAVIKCTDFVHGREIAYDLFGSAFHNTFLEEDWPESRTSLYPGGLIPVNF